MAVDQSAEPAKSGPSEKALKKGEKQWTNRLAGLLDNQGSVTEKGEGGTTASSLALASSRTAIDPSQHPPPIEVSLRLEGPYFTPADPAHYDTVVCLVAGTGVSGAIAIVGAFKELERSRARARDGQGDGLPLSPVYASPSPPSSLVWSNCVVVWSVRQEDCVALPFLESEPRLSSSPIFNTVTVLTTLLL